MPGILGVRYAFSKIGVALPSINAKPGKEHRPRNAPIDDVAVTLTRQTGLVAKKNGTRDSKPQYPTYDLIPGKLSVVFHPTLDFSRSEIKKKPELFFFSTDLHEKYIPFCKDFGPVSLGIMYRFWQYVRSKEHHPHLGNRPLVYYTDLRPKNQANAAVLLGAYMMFEHNVSARDATSAFKSIPSYPFASFRDATHQPSNFGIDLEDCLNGLEKAMKVGWFNKDTFDVSQFEDLEDPDGGDVSVVGDRFIAFRGPRMTATETSGWECPPSFYIDLFQKHGVTDIVRLNEAESYDKDDFKSHGFKVHDLEFPDCTCPSRERIKQFLDVCDTSKGKIAVHCKAGLGRTGTMIGLWMMKHLEFSARESIAFLRLNRPGCVIGEQQHFLLSCEKMVWDANNIIPLPTSPSSESLRSSSESAPPSASSSTSSFCSSSSSRVSCSSSIASGAGTPLRASLIDKSLFHTLTQKEIQEKEELGLQIEQASRNRASQRRGSRGLSREAIQFI